MAKVATKAQLGILLARIAAYFLQMNEDMVGATASAAGEKGMVPAPAAGKQGAFLRGDGTWAQPALAGAAFHVGSDAPTDAGVMWIKTTD